MISWGHITQLLWVLFGMIAGLGLFLPVLLYGR